MNLTDVTGLVLRIRPDWQREPTMRALGQWMHQHPTATIEDCEEMARAAAQDGAVRTPAGLAYRPAPAPAEDQPALPGAPDQPEVPIYCAHGVGLWDRTKTGEPQCPYCRGITRAKRNKFVPGFRLAGHRPCAHDDDVPASIDLDDPVTVPAADEPDLSQ
jgi:hypothetical protein